MLAAMQQDGMALEYASEALKADRELVLAAGAHAQLCSIPWLAH